MEILCRLVHREGYVTAGRVPIGIDQRGEILELLRFQLDHLIAHGQIGSAPFRTHVKQHPVGILLAEGVAVDTVEIAHLVFVDRGLLKTAQIALVNAHPVPQCITRLDEPVGQVAVDRLGSHADRDRLVTLPALRILAEHRGLHLPSLGSLQERMPLLKRDVERSPIACHFQRLSASGQLQGKGLSLLLDGKVERSDVDRNRHIGIIGKNLRLAIQLACHVRLLPAGSKQEQAEECRGYEVQSASHCAFFFRLNIR